MLISPDELDPFRKLALIDLSYSRLDTFQGCEAKFWFSYIAQEPRTFGPAAVMGNVLHSVLENADFDVLDYDALLEDMAYQREEVYDRELMIPDELIEAGKVMLAEFCDRHEDEEFHILDREKPFELVLGTGLFRGYIDRVDLEDGGGVRVIDYKSGKFEVAAKNVATNLQVGLYALAAEYLYPDLWPITGELYYLRSGKRKSHTYTREELREVESKLVNVVKDYIETRTFQYTSDAKQCLYLCDFGKSGVCPRGAGVIRNSGGRGY